MSLRATVVIILVFSSIALGAVEGNFTLNEQKTEVNVAAADINHTSINISLADISYQKSEIDGVEQYKLSLPDELGISRGAFLGDGNSVMPTITRMVAVPFDSDPSVKVISSHFVDIPDIVLAPAEGEELASFRNDTPEMTARLQNEIAVGEVAGEMRDVRIYTITVSPVRYDMANSRLRVYDQIEIEVDHAGSQITRLDNRISEAFAPIYRSVLDNALIFDPIEMTRGAYWVIYPDAYYEYISPIAEWKRLKGFDVEYIPKSDIGSSPTYVIIKNYISARFDTCQVKPDYITLVGDVTAPYGYNMPTREYSNPYGFGDIESDNYYTFLLGNDYFPDLFIGRICVDYATEITSYTNKFFQYERNPYLENTAWYLRGTMVCYWETGGWYDDFTSPRITKLWCRDAMLEDGFTQVDTLFQNPSRYISSYEINASINNGVGYVNYRGFGDAYGWSYPRYTYSDFGGLTNGPMYPIMTSVVCGTGDFNDNIDVCFGEHWIRDTNKGGAGFIGNSNHDAHTRWTNALDVGTYWGLFMEHVSTLAQAQLMGKMTMYGAFPADRNPNGQVDLYFNSYNVLGDPEINCWTAVPGTMTVAHPDTLEFGQNLVSVNVTGRFAEPLEGAYVSLFKDGEVFAGAFTPATGNVDLEIQPNTAGPISLTVTAHNYAPYEGTIELHESEVAVGYSSHVVDDDENGESSGNGDGICNPSETIELGLTLQNYGVSETAFGVTAEISSNSPDVEIIRGTANFADIAPGETSSADMPYVISIDQGAFNGSRIDLMLSVTDANENSWQSIIRLPVEAAEFKAENVIVQDGNDGIIEPGEAFELVVELLNTGALPITGASAVLRSSDDQVTIIDSTAYFGNCAPGASFDNTSDTFMLMVDQDIYVGHLLNFTIELEGDGPQQVAAAFSQQVGTVTSHDPVGPDNYGYYCFDNTDVTYPSHPEYDWVTIDIQNWSYVTLYDDQTQTIALPFTVQYYGRTFDEVSICDNGFIALGSTWWNAWFNTNIPAPQNAEAMIAPFWDDFVESYFRIYYHYDTDNSRFIVGWYQVRDDDVSRDQTFEIIILDRTAWPSVSGDNEIIFQYYNIGSLYSMSAGICSPDREDGIGYVFNGAYAEGAAALGNSMALKFTTGSEYATDVDEDAALPSVLSLSQNYPNPFNASTQIEFSLPDANNVRLEMFDLLGRKVATVVDGRLDAGAHRITWNAGDMPSGVYFYRLTSGERSETKRMTLLK